jgi:hypothetical protein
VGTAVKLPGRYKGARRRREPPIAAECPCGWKSKPTNPKRAEKRFAGHVALAHIAIATLFLFAAIFFASPAFAQNHPASVSGNCNATNSCAFCSSSCGTGLVVPAANQVMVMLISGPGDNETLSSIADTYGIGGSCSGSTCGGWTQFSVGSHAHTNSNQGITAQMVGYWAKTGTHSGAETVTLTWSSGGTARLMPLSSYAATDVNVTATNVEDASAFHEDTNANSCSSPSPTIGGGSAPNLLTLSYANDVVMSLIDYNTTFDEPNNSSSGPTQNVIAVSRRYYFASLTGWTGSTGTLAAVSAGSQTITWTWGSCVGTAGNAGIYTVALKNGSTATNPNCIFVICKYHPPKQREPILDGIAPIWLRRKELTANGR